MGREPSAPVRRWRRVCCTLPGGFTTARVALPACFHPRPLHRLPTLAADGCRVWQTYTSSPKFPLTRRQIRVGHHNLARAGALRSDSPPHRRRVAAQVVSNLLRRAARAARIIRNNTYPTSYRAAVEWVTVAPRSGQPNGRMLVSCTKRSRGRVGMATRPTGKAAAKAKPAPARGARAPRPLPAASTSDSNRLLREAAWSAMFGRVESKNPFTR